MARVLRLDCTRLMTVVRQTLGRQGERFAEQLLRRRGCVTLARRYRTRFGEIDLIARDRDALVFVEVKTRRTRRFGGPLAAVGFRKQQRLVKMARSYLSRWPGPLPPCRFDVVGVILRDAEPPSMEIVADAFRVV